MTQPKKGVFQIRKRRVEQRDRMVFRMSKVEETLLSDLGDPVTTTGYTLCVYDESGGTPSLLTEFTVPPGGVCSNRRGTRTRPCWKKVGNKYKYHDPQRANDGIYGVRLKAEGAGKAKIVVLARGPNVPDFPTPLNVDKKVIVQLINDVSPAPMLQCWGAEFREPVNKNRADWFRDRTD